jgi:hypothetical protein
LLLFPQLTVSASAPTLRTSLSFNNHAALCTTGRDLAWALFALSIGAFVLCLAVVVTWLTLRLKGLMAAHRSHEETHVVEMLFVATLAILALFGYLVFDGGHMKLSSHVLKAQGALAWARPRAPPLADAARQARTQPSPRRRSRCAARRRCSSTPCWPT